ncbi:MAG: dUTP diphosphatase [Nitrospirae bacterium]|nr:dUTP diphosphatase [Nitrospirota bacterium]
MPHKITLKIKRLPHSEGLPLPEYQTEHAAGMDLLAAVEGEAVVEPGRWKLKHGIGLVNAPGTIDADYRGEVGIILINFGDSPFVIRRGDRIAQMVLGKVYRAEVEVSEDLSETGRHEGGFGHTGHN